MKAATRTEKIRTGFNVNLELKRLKNNTKKQLKTTATEIKKGTVEVEIG
jgi:hypothetical protein